MELKEALTAKAAPVEAAHQGDFPAAEGTGAVVPDDEFGHVINMGRRDAMSPAPAPSGNRSGNR